MIKKVFYSSDLFNDIILELKASINRNSYEVENALYVEVAIIDIDKMISI